MLSELRKARSNYFHKLIEEANGNSSKLWQHINRVADSNKHKYVKINGLKVHNSLVDNNVAMADAFINFFIGSVEELSANFRTIEENDNAHSDDFQIKVVSSDAVKNALQI